MVCFWWKIPLKWMIGGYPYFRKPPYDDLFWFRHLVMIYDDLGCYPVIDCDLDHFNPAGCWGAHVSGPGPSESEWNLRWTLMKLHKTNHEHGSWDIGWFKHVFYVGYGPKLARCKFKPQAGGGFLVAAVLWGTFRWPAAPHDVAIGPVEFPPPHFLRIGLKRNNISAKPTDTTEFPHVVAPSAPSWLLCVLGIVKARLQNKNVNTELPWKYSRIFQEQNLHSNWLKIQSLGAFGCSMPLKKGMWRFECGREVFSPIVVHSCSKTMNTMFSWHHLCKQILFIMIFQMV